MDAAGDTRPLPRPAFLSRVATGKERRRAAQGGARAVGCGKGGRQPPLERAAPAVPGASGTRETGGADEAAAAGERGRVRANGQLSTEGRGLAALA